LKIEELLMTRLRNKTVIAVNHRLEAALKSDRIVVLDHGKIVDVGTPHEMLQRCDLFSGLKMQEDRGAV
jgi:ABC-type multidrug transport system fused ATPase/permease subunit